MILRPIICGSIAIATIVACWSAVQAADPIIPVDSESGKLSAIGQCLRQDREAVLLRAGVQCMDYRKGAGLLAEKAPETPFDLEVERDCTRKSGTQNDARHLSSDVVQRLLNDSNLKIGPAGIRIFGAIFCDRVNLIGLELPFSLVLDKSSFARGIEIRNLRIKGDISFDNSLILEQMRMIRSHVEGSFFGERSFIDQLQLSNSTIDSNASFSESVLFESTQIFNVTVAREISIRGSAVSYFVTQFSNVGEALDLSHSQARCAYHVNKSEIGYVVARRAGFGTVQPPSGSGSPPGYYAWREADLTPPVQHILSTAEAKKLTSNPEPCINRFDRPLRAEFFIFDNSIKSSLCLNEFKWLGPRDGSPFAPPDFFNPRPSAEEYLRTLIAINGNTIGSNLIIDLWPEDANEKDINYEVPPRLHKFEAIGVKAGGLVVDFAESNQNHVTTAVDGLQFDRLYNGHASCEYGGGRNLTAFDDRALLLISDFTKELELPKVDDALRWLDLNTIESTQPYTAFSNAFTNAGVDATRIVVARENRQLCARAARWLPAAFLQLVCRNVPKAPNSGASAQHLTSMPQRDSGSVGNGWRQLGATLISVPGQLSDLAQLGFRGGLYVLADHGYRPAKVLWWVTLTLAGFWIWFLGPFNVVAYTSKADSSSSSMKMRPIGLLFLFDRLLPAYQIDSSHYQIESYFKRIPISEATNRTAPVSIVRRVLVFRWPVERITDERKIARIEQSLLVLRIFGVVFAIFLAAAVSAIVIR
jgi:hypothetical protein